MIIIQIFVSDADIKKEVIKMTFDDYFDKGYAIADLLNMITKLEEENKKLKEELNLINYRYVYLRQEYIKEN
jgi:hypothetical protein